MVCSVSFKISQYLQVFYSCRINVDKGTSKKVPWKKKEKKKKVIFLNIWFSVTVKRKDVCVFLEHRKHLTQLIL